MTNFNFLSKSSSRSCSHSSVTLASTVGSPSVHHRGTMIKHVAFLLLFLFAFGIGNAWGANVTWQQVAWSDISTSDVIIVTVTSNNVTYLLTSANGDTATPKLGNTGTLGSNNTTCTFSENDNVKWKKDASNRLCMATNSNKWLYTGTSNNAMRVGTSTSGNQWTQDGDYIKSNTSSARYLSVYGTTDFRSYTSKSDGQVTRFYKAGASCDKKVTVTKSTATNGSFTLKAGSASGTTINNSGTVDNCDADATIVVIPSANTHYHVSEVTATDKTNLTGPDASGNYTITYTKGSNINTTIGVTFAEDTKYTLNYHDGSGSGTRTNIYEGTNLIEALGTPAASCDATSTTFKGWSTTEITTKTNTAPTYVSENAVVNSTTAAATYYAVYAKGTDVATPVANTWTRITNVNQLTDGATVLLVQYYYDKALNTSLGISSVTANAEINNSTANLRWALEKSGTKWKFKTSSGAYLSTSSTDNNAEPALNATYDEWTISADNGGGSGSDNTYTNTNCFRLNNGSDLECYYKSKDGSYTFKLYTWSIKYSACYPFYIYIQKTTINTTYSDYITTCCTSLASINGSFSRTNLLILFAPLFC